MELTVNYLGNVQFEAVARGHKLICDQPFDNKGDDEGMTPPELLLASLATCSAFYAVQYLNSRQLPSEGLTVSISSQKVLNPARMDQFKITINAPGVTTEKDIEGIRRSAEKCLIKNTLLASPTISVDVTTAAASTAVR